VADLRGSAIFLGPEEDIPTAEAIRLIDSGEAIPSAPVMERAVRKPREKR
jgi:hypothetical protein